MPKYAISSVSQSTSAPPFFKKLNKRNASITFQLEIADGPQSLHWIGMEGGITVAPLDEEIRTVVLTLPRADWKKELPLRFRVLSSDGTVIEKTGTFFGPIIP